MIDDTHAHSAAPVAKKPEGESVFDQLRANTKSKTTSQSAAAIQQLRKILREEANRNA